MCATPLYPDETWRDLHNVTAPNQLLIAAAAAAVPLMGGTAMILAPGTHSRTAVSLIVPVDLSLGPIASINCIGWDALAGYTFARVAQNHGQHFPEHIYVKTLIRDTVSFQAITFVHSRPLPLPAVCLGH